MNYVCQDHYNHCQLSPPYQVSLVTMCWSATGLRNRNYCCNINYMGRSDH